MKSITLEELKQNKEELPPFELVTVGGSDFVVKRMSVVEYLEYIDWYQEQGKGEDNRETKFNRIITDTVCVDDEGGGPLFTNGQPSEYLARPGDLAALGTKCGVINGMWDPASKEEDTAKN